MDIERLRKIIEFSDCNRSEIDVQIRQFYAFAGMNRDKDVINIMQIVRTSFEKTGYLVLEIPFADQEIGALCYKGDALGYVVLNTSLPKINVNFALCHELFHVLYQKNEVKTKVEFAKDHYYEDKEEFAANVFAGMLLMPEESFCFMYKKFREDSDGNRKDTLIRLMNYYQAPYMAVLIRSLELRLLEEGTALQELLEVNVHEIRERFVELWLDESILNASKRDDFLHIEAVVKRFGMEYVQEEYLNERTLKRVLQNMRQLYDEIKEK